MTLILRIIAWLLTAAVTFATLGPARLRPHSDLGQDGEHALAFVLVGLACKNAMKAKGIEKPIVASLAGDIEVEEAADYLYQNGIVAYAYSTEIPVAVLGAKYKWARGAGLL